MQNKEYQQQISTNYLWGGSVLSVKEKYLNLKSKHTYIHIHTYTQVHKHTHTNTECTHPIMYHHTWCLKVSRQGKVTSILLLITVLESLIIKKKEKRYHGIKKNEKLHNLKGWNNATSILHITKLYACKNYKMMELINIFNK